MYLAAGRLVGRHRVVELVGMGDVVTTDRHDLRSVLVDRREGGREEGGRGVVAAASAAAAVAIVAIVAIVASAAAAAS